MRLGARTLAGFLALSLLAACGVSCGPSAEASYLRGRLLAESQQHERAVAMYVRALKSRPDWLEARLHLGFSYLRLEEWEKAVEQLAAVCTADPELARQSGALVGLGEAKCEFGKQLLQQGDWDGAIVQIQEAVTLCPSLGSDREVLHSLALAYAHKGDATTVAAVVAKRRELGPAPGRADAEGEARAYFALGRVWADAGKWDEAQLWLRRALQLETSGPTAELLARVLVQIAARALADPDVVGERKRGTVVSLCEEALRLSPASVEARSVLGRALMRPDLWGGEAEYARALVLHAEALQLAREKDARLAEEVVRDYVAAAMYCVETDKREAAMQALDRLVTLGVRSRDVHFLRGVLHKEAGRYDKAVADFREVLRLDPDDRDARKYLNLGRKGLTGLTRLTAGYSAIWAPDGQAVAFVGKDGRYLGVLRLGEGSPTGLYEGGVVYSPDWSPDGTRVAFIEELPPSGAGAAARPRDLVRLVDVRTRKSTVLAQAEGIEELAWSPDGKAILYLADGLLWLAWPEDGRTKLLVSRETNAYIYAAAWSPGGKEIAALVWEGEEGPNVLWILDVERGTARVIRDFPGILEKPRWSPDGTRILFQVYVGPGDEDDEYWEKRFEVWCMDATVGAAVKLSVGRSDDCAPMWSPDGSQIGFISRAWGERWGKLWVMSADGCVQYQLGADELPVTAFSWSPDGRKILFVSGGTAYLPGGVGEPGVLYVATRE